LVVSVLGNVEQFASDEFHRLVSQVPNLSVIIEHLAGMRPGAEAPYEVYKRALALASYPNTYMKVGGLGEICVRPSILGNSLAFDDAPSLIEMALEAFGPERMMWGSDYPPVSSREGYGNALRGVMEHPAMSGPGDREWVMGKTAAKVFRLN
jgi:L-fuconolactonase